VRALALSWRAFVCSDAGASLVSVGTVVGPPWPGCVRAFLCAFRLVAEVRAVGVFPRPFGAGSLPLGGCTAALLRRALARGVAVPCGGGGGSPCGLAGPGVGTWIIVPRFRVLSCWSSSSGFQALSVLKEAPRCPARFVAFMSSIAFVRSLISLTGVNAALWLFPRSRNRYN
jgi:hypothetical protein